MERLAAPVAMPKSETRFLASGAGGGGAADKGAQLQVGPPQWHWLPASLPEQHGKHPKTDPDQ